MAKTIGLIIKEEIKEKTFDQMTATEQIAIIEKLEKLEELEALKEQSPKQSALVAIDKKIKTIKGE